MGKGLRFQYIHEHSHKGEIANYCKLMEVSVSGYSKYIKSLSKPYKYAELLASIEAILQEDGYNKTYGKLRTYEKLQLDYDCPYSYHTVSKVMREHGLLKKRNNSKWLTKSDKEAHKSDDLLNRDFTAIEPCQKLVTDITEFQCRDGKIYLSGIFDCFDNACLALSISDNMKTELVIDSYRSLLSRYDVKNAISHSDRGSQYTSKEFRKLLRQNHIIQSMNSASGRCHDNAKCESMWARGKEEMKSVHKFSKLSKTETSSIIYDYYLDYWNNRRISSSIGGLPPMTKRGAYYESLLDLAA